MKTKLKTYALYLLIAMYAFGGPGFVWFPDFFKPFTPYTLLFTSFVFLIHQSLTKPFILSFMAVCLIGFISEVAGVKTGWIFGNYYYGQALGYKLFGVPLVISLNWALLVTACLQVAAKFLSPSLLLISLAAGMATAVDFLMEQVVTKVDFWYFTGGKAGLHNYIGWLGIALVAGWCFHKPLVKGNFKIAVLILSLQVYFFGILYFLN